VRWNPGASFAGCSALAKRRTKADEDEFDALVSDYTRLFGASAARTLKLRSERESVRRR